MIIKTAQNPNAGALFRHLTRIDHNERVDVAQLRGVVAEGFQEALAEMEAVACGTQCEKNFYHVSVAIQDHEQLKREQWLDVAERIGQEFGIEDHARAVVFHVKDGKEHMHVVFSRIDPETMKAAHLSHDYRRVVRLARELEQELGLEPVQSRREEQRELQRPAHDWEAELGRRAHVSPQEHRDILADCYRVSDNGKAFQAALSECGFTLCAGDRRSYLAVEVESGALYAIDKRLTGDSAAKIRERFSDLPPLPHLSTVGKNKDQAKGGRDGQDGNAKETAKTEQERQEQRHEDWRELYQQQSREQFLLGKQQREIERQRFEELNKQILKERLDDPRANWFKRVAFKLIGRDLDAERDARDEVRIEKRLKEIAEIRAQHEAERLRLLEAQQRAREELLKLHHQQDLERRREQDKASGIVRARLNRGQENEKDKDKGR